MQQAFPTLRVTRPRFSVSELCLTTVLGQKCRCHKGFGFSEESINLFPYEGFVHYFVFHSSFLFAIQKVQIMNHKYTLNLLCHVRPESRHVTTVACLWMDLSFSKHNQESRRHHDIITRLKNENLDPQFIWQEIFENNLTFENLLKIQ